MDTLDTFVTAKEGDIVLRMHKDEAPLLQEYAMALSTQALSTLAKRYGFTPQGPILVEMFPKHDDFAVRNVGLPGMIGALGACFGRVVTLDSPRARPAGRVPVGSDALARAGARHHAADVEAARAPVADRRHFGVRGDARASRVGPRAGRPVRPDAERRVHAEAPRPELRVHRPADDFDGVFPGLAPRRAPRRRLWGRSAAQAAARLRRGHGHRGGVEDGARHRFRSPAGRIRSDALHEVRRHAAGARGAREGHRAPEDAGGGAEGVRGAAS